jgi:hypothetical protein
MNFGLEDQEFKPKIVGRRHHPSDGLSLAAARTADDARAWKRALGLLPIRKGVYRFKTHEEADRWLWERLTSRR